ncbi:hypothetical protein SLA2020_511250 [Shorea laevis]
MKGGTLEVLLVNAEDIRHTNILGTPVYYVVTQLGSHEHRSRVSEAKEAKVLWNEKFKFDFPMHRWKRLTHIKFRIMDRELFSNGGFVGETIIHLGGIISEGNYRGLIEVKPAPYNVVLEDDTYKGQIKIGFRFIPHHFAERGAEETQESVGQVNEQRQSICSSVFNLWKFLCSLIQNSSKNKQKDN